MPSIIKNAIKGCTGTVFILEYQMISEEGDSGYSPESVNVHAHRNRHGSTTGKNLLSIKYVAKCYGVIPCENT